MAKATDVIDKYIKQLDSIVDVAFNSTYTREVAKELADQIKKRTRLGYGLTSGGGQKALKKLSPTYIEQRERLANKLYSETTPSKSNLTATGQLLNAIEGTGQTGQIEISIKSTRGRGLTGKKTSITNNQVREFVEKDRPFFGITKAEKTALIKTLKQRLLSTAQKLLRNQKGE